MSYIELPSFTKVEEWRIWLTETAVRHELSFEDTPLILLIHTSEGVIWGRLDATDLQLSGELFSTWQNDIKRKTPHIDVILERKTLQQLRLFNLSGELLIWQDQDKFKYAVTGTNDAELETTDTQYLLWGTEIIGSFDDFYLLQEGERGLWHAPPAFGTTGNSAQLNIRHYINYDKMGQAYFSGTRLLGLEWR